MTTLLAVVAALFITACEALALTHDHLGTPWYLTDKSKGVAWRGRYYPSGELYFEQVSTQTQRYRLPGQYHDQETGLYYNWHRYYDPTIGRYYQADPIGIAGGMNMYAYAFNSPTHYFDKTGLDGIRITYDGYMVNTGINDIRLPLGHSGVVAVNEQTGLTKYYEYGRYGGDFGAVRNQKIPNLKIGKDGKPTSESLTKLMDYLSSHYGQGKKVQYEYYSDADFNKIVDYAKGIMNDPQRDEYGIFSNNVVLPI